MMPERSYTDSSLVTTILSEIKSSPDDALLYLSDTYLWHMFDRIFPSGLNNDYHGQSLAIYLLYIILTISIIIGIFTYDFSSVESSIVLRHVLLGILLLALVLRFRSMIPLVYLCMLLTYSLEVYSTLIYNQKTELLALTSTPLVIYVLTILGFLLSITGDRCYYRNNAVLKRP